MKYHELQTRGRKSATRAGRGIASGRGKTAGRGTKGQSSRTGGKVRPGFEGGQNPLYMRLPKLPGFRSIRPQTEVIYTGQLDAFGAKTIDNKAVAEAGMVSNPYTNVKVVVKGKVTKKVSVKLQGATKSAQEQIKKAGGSFEAAQRPQRTAQLKSEK